MKISRDEEAKLPDFSSHQEARNYFKELYREQFVLNGSELIDGRKVYFYHLILDTEHYQEGMEVLKTDGYMKDAMQFLISYQPIEISEDGSVHIIH